MRALGLLPLAVLLSVGCPAPADGRAPAVNLDIRKGKGKMTTQATQPSVQVHFAGSKPGRPPQVRLALDFTLSNPGAEARWFLLPRNVGGDDGGGVDTLEIVQAGGVHIGRFLGTGGFHAVRLGPGASLKLRQLPVTAWGAEPGELQLPVRVARELKLGADTAAAWFGKDVTSKGGDVDAGKGEIVGSHKSPTGDEVRVELVDAQQLKAQVTIPK